MLTVLTDVPSLSHADSCTCTARVNDDIILIVEGRGLFYFSASFEYLVVSYTLFLFPPCNNKNDVIMSRPRLVNLLHLCKKKFRCALITAG